MSSQKLGQYRKKFKPGEVLLQEGETAAEILLVEKGILDVFIQGRKIDSIDAASSQDFIGEVGAVMGTPRTATVIAATDCSVLCLPGIELEAVLKNSPSLGIKLVRSLCKKLFNSSSVLADTQSKSTSILNSASTEISLKNYMKGLLLLMELAADDASGPAGRNLVEYFLRTNPWGLQHGDRNQVLDVDTSDSS